MDSLDIPVLYEAPELMNGNQLMIGNQLGERVTDYVAWLQDHGRAADTVTLYRQKVRHFCEWANAREITPRLLFEYRDYLQSDKIKPWTGGERGCRPRTVRSAFGALRSFWKFLAQDGALGLPDIACVPAPPLDTAQREVPSVEQVRRLYAAAAQSGAHARSPRYALYLRARTQALLSVAFGTALRRSELLALDLQDVRLDATPPRITVRMGKGRKARWVNLGEHEAAHLRQWVEVRAERLAQSGKENPALWIDDKGRRMGHNGIEGVVDSLKRLAGLDDTKITLHGLRHRAGSIIVKDLGYKCAQEVLGHKSIQTTLEVYTHTDADDLAHAASAVSNAIHTPQRQPSKALAHPTERLPQRSIRRSAGNPRRLQRV